MASSFLEHFNESHSQNLNESPSGPLPNRKVFERDETEGREGEQRRTTTKFMSSAGRGGSTASRNSAAAAGYAAKKREQLEKAAELKAQRAATQSGAEEPRSSEPAVGAPRRSELDQLHAKANKAPPRSSAARSHEATDRYMNDFHSAYDELAAKQGLPPVCAPAANIGVGQDMTGIVGQLASITITELGVQWRTGPRVEAGQLVDLSDRPLLCMALSLDRNEAAIGGSDHSVYTVDLKSGRKARTLYTKKYGHTEWVTDVAYMADGRILSSGMDSKICVWDRAGVRCSVMFRDVPPLHNFPRLEMGCPWCRTWSATPLRSPQSVHAGPTRLSPPATTRPCASGTWREAPTS